MEGLEKAIENINAKAEEINNNGLEVKSLKEKNAELEGQIKSTKDELVKMSGDLAKLKEVPTQPKKQKSVLDIVSEKSEGLESLAKKNDIKEMVDFSVKATQTYGDIDAGLDFAPMRPGITDIPKKQTNFINLFRRVPFNGEFYKYAE